MQLMKRIKAIGQIAIGGVLGFGGYVIVDGREAEFFDNMHTFKFTPLDTFGILLLAVGGIFLLLGISTADTIKNKKTR